MPVTDKNIPAPEEQPKPTKAEAVAANKERLAKAEAALAQARTNQAQLEAEVEAAKPPAPTDSTPLPSDERLASEATEDEVARAQILRDPFDTKNALKILTDPPGKKLRWLSVVYREMRNMKGWQPVRYDDPIGREIHKYIGEPPSRMFGSAEQDALVRRGDVFLAWIDEGIWLERQRKRSAEASRKISPHQTKVQNQIGLHGVTTDPGLQQDANPYQLVRKAPGFVMPTEQAYRDRAKGTVDDPAQRVEGQNMFEEAPDEE
jgi:hypothetical protein